MLELLDIHKQKYEPWPIPYTLYKNELKIDHRHKYKTQNYKTFRRKPFDLGLGRVIRYDTITMIHKGKNW